MKFFGWRMVFTGLTLEFTVVGFLFYSFPVFWPYLISELGMTESQLGMVSAFYFIPIAAIPSALPAFLSNQFEINLDTARFPIMTDPNARIVR